MLEFYKAQLAEQLAEYKNNQKALDSNN